jgi:EAL and modified HD-GYP domain-containing signal transduction protein
MKSELASVRFISRQPILDAKRRVYGYELLFRSGHENVFSGDGEDATRDVIDQCLLLMPESEREASFINCTRRALTAGLVTLLPPATTVLEILEDVYPDAELMAACHSLKRKGYRFALDDFGGEREKLPFLEIADFIKVDFLASDAAARKPIYAMAAGAKVTFLAEKVEAEADVKVAQAEGCKLFQGYYFSRPILVSTGVIPQNHIAYLRLLAALTRSPSDVTEIESLVMSDAPLCYRLLRLVNSALYGFRSTIQSIRSAILIVGDDEFRKMVTVALPSVAAREQTKAIAHMALERAKFCELLAPLIGESASRLYLIGMLSVIDVILGTPMTQIMEAIPIDAEMKAALTGKKSKLTSVLDLVRCHETGDLDGHEQLQRELGLSERKASSIYIESVRWAERTRLTLDGPQVRQPETARVRV